MATWRYVALATSGEEIKGEAKTLYDALLDAYTRKELVNIRVVNLTTRTGKTFNRDELRRYIANHEAKLLAKQKRAKNPLPMPDIVLRFNDLIATIGSIPTTGKRFLLLKKRGERKPILDSVMPMDMIRDKLAKIGFDVSGLRGENPVTPRGKNGKWGFTVWIEKDGYTASKQTIGYQSENDAIIGALKANQAKNISPQNKGAVIFKRPDNETGGDYIAPPDISYRLTYDQLIGNASHKRGINPVTEGRTSKIKKATALYEDFRDQPGAEILDLPMPDFSTGMVIGRLSAVEYDTVRAGKREDYRHTFKKSAAPLLCVTACGKYLFTVNGGFTFTERGIVDN